MQINIAAINNISLSILGRIGVPDGDANIITDSILYAHTRGKGTHGIGRLPIYARKVENGLMNPQTGFSPVNENGAVGLYDANHGFGQVAACKGMEKAVEKAERHGIGAVGIRHSNNFGCAGYFAKVAAKNNCIGLVFSNSNPAIAPVGGHTPIFGTNPLAIGFPEFSGGG